MTPASVQEFAAAAREYCAWSEASRTKYAIHAFQHLSRLVELIARVPQGPGGTLEPPARTEEECQAVFRGFAGIPVSFYQSQHNPLDLEQSKIGVGDVHDDLADIWSDLSEGLAVFDAGDAEAAAFHWRLLYQVHWGRHATGAMYALHCWLSDNGDDA